MEILEVPASNQVPRQVGRFESKGSRIKFQIRNGKH